MGERIVRRPNGDIDVERSSLTAVLLAEAGGPPRCPKCKCPPFLGPHHWNCPERVVTTDTPESPERENDDA